MNFLPKDIENIIIDYKEQIIKSEHQEKFKKTLDEINNISHMIIDNDHSIIDCMFMKTRSSTRNYFSYLRNNIEVFSSEKTEVLSESYESCNMKRTKILIKHEKNITLVDFIQSHWTSYNDSDIEMDFTEDEESSESYFDEDYGSDEEEYERNKDERLKREAENYYNHW